MATKRFSGKTLNDALSAARGDLGLAAAEVRHTVVDEGAKGVFGIGARDAVIEVEVGGREDGAPAASAAPAAAPRSSRPDKRAWAEEAARDILRLMGFDLAVSALDEPDQIVVEISGPATELLVARRDQPLQAFQFILNKIVNRFPEDRKRIVVDVEGHRKKRQEDLEVLARSLAAKVRESSKPITVLPMSPRDRRTIHLALRDDQHVATRSEGEGVFRRLLIVPQRGGPGRRRGPKETAGGETERSEEEGRGTEPRGDES